MVSGKKPYSEMIAYPKVKEEKDNAFIGTYTYKSAIGYFQNKQNYNNTTDFKLSEYSNPNNKDKHILLSSGWGKPIRRLCETLKINLESAKVSFAYSWYKTRPEFDRNIDKIKITFVPDPGKRALTYNQYK